MVDGPHPTRARAQPASAVRSRLLHRELVLLIVLIAVTVGAFLATRAFAFANDRMRQRDAAAWFATGTAALQTGDTRTAIDALRRASRLDRRDRDISLALGSALAADRQDDAARQLLAGLRETSPDDPDVDIQLARLEARSGDPAQAVRYYHAAADALWRPPQARARRAVRVELIRLLLAQGDRQRALSETLLLAADQAPDEGAAALEEADLLLAAGDPARALDRYEEVLRRDPDNREARAGAGRAAFERGDYPRASRYLSRIADGSPAVREARDLAALVLADDPMAARLTQAERVARLRAIVEHVRDRLGNCPAAPSPPADLDAIEGLLTGKTRVSRDDIERGTELACQLSERVDAVCGPTAPIDRALQLIARLHGFEDRS
jgi:tetratricopeptide (TPR) repeat protein